MEFLNGNLGESHKYDLVFGLVFLSFYVRTVDLFTMQFQVNEYPPLAGSPQPVGPSTSSVKLVHRTKTMHCSIPKGFCYATGLPLPPHTDTLPLLAAVLTVIKCRKSEKTKYSVIKKD